jgi:hypothetical protein
MKFKTKFLKEELDLPYSAVEDWITGHGRWNVHHAIVFKYDDTFYMANYSVGATEMQDERPWEYEDEVECMPVKQVEKIIKGWEPLNVESEGSRTSARSNTE